jgi:hypothetical protein|tara:strand:+ start:436 stop:588 length:153 start_codon:yes stop_codon:yes gene_type:complete
MLHFLFATLVVYIVFLALLPQQVAAATLLLVTSVVTLIGKIDWTTIPYQP